MNTRKPLSVQVVKRLHEEKAEQNKISPGSYDVIELPNGKYRLEGNDHVYEVDAGWLSSATKDAKAAIYSKWV